MCVKLEVLMVTDYIEDTVPSNHFPCLRN